VCLEEVQDIFVQQAAVRSEGISGLEAKLLRQSFHIPHSLLELDKSQERLTAVKADEAPRGEIGMEKIYGLDEGRKFQAFFVLLLITIRAIKIARVGQYDG
jgi:hypothetical protein